MESIILQHAPAEVVRALLIQLGVATAGLSYADWPVFVDEEPDNPHNCITVREGLGTIHGRLQPTGEVQEHYGIQIRVRGIRTATGTDQDPGYKVARRRIDYICQQLSEVVRNTSVTIGSITYRVHSASRDGSVNPIGRTRANRERYVFTVEYTFSIAQT